MTIKTDWIKINGFNNGKYLLDLKLNHLNEFELKVKICMK